MFVNYLFFFVVLEMKQATRTTVPIKPAEMRRHAINVMALFGEKRKSEKC